MVYTSDTFFDLIFNNITNINFLQIGTNYLVILLIVFVSAILISPRKMSNIKVLALPLMVGYTIIGLKVPLLFIAIGGILFVMEVLSMKQLGEMIGAVTQAGTNIINIPTQYKERQLSTREKKLGNLKREKSIDKQKSEIPLDKFQKMFGTGKEYKSELERRKDRKFIRASMRDEAISEIMKVKNKSARDKMLKEFFDRAGYWEVDE